MAQATFYAARADEIDVLRFVFHETDCEVYESYSRFDDDLRRFASLDDVCGALDVGKDRPRETRMILLDLWSPATGGKPTITRHELKVKGASFRWEIGGWGLFRLQLGGSGDGIISSSWFAHNSEKRARRWSDTYTQLGPPDAWDWKAVTNLGRRIIYHIRDRLAVAKLESAAVLPEADELRRGGWMLRQ
jgi:hypothetical protein